MMLSLLKNRVMQFVLCLALVSCGDSFMGEAINISEEDFDTNLGEVSDNQRLLKNNGFEYEYVPGLSGESFKLMGPINKNVPRQDLYRMKNMIDNSTLLLRSFYIKYNGATVITDNGEELLVDENHRIMKEIEQKIVANIEASKKIEAYLKQSGFQPR